MPTAPRAARGLIGQGGRLAAAGPPNRAVSRFCARGAAGPRGLAGSARGMRSKAAAEPLSDSEAATGSEAAPPSDSEGVGL